MSELGDRIVEAFTHQAESGFARADDLLGRWSAMGPLSANELAGLKSFDSAFEVRFVYNSNSIEGSTLTLGETALVLDGEFVPDRPGRDYFAARGSADGMAYYRKALKEGQTVSEDLVLNVHERTALDCQPASRGVYRQYPVYLRGSQVVPANWAGVPELMSTLFAAYADSSQHPLYKAAAFHAMFEHIHPFGDGNGRTGRLLLNFMLEQAGYPPIAISADNRTGYLQAVELWQVEGDAQPLLSMIGSCVCDELEARIGCVMDARAKPL